MKKSYQKASIITGLLFIIATTTTMGAQILLEPLMGPDMRVHIDGSKTIFTVAALLEVMNALASGGIAIAFYPIIWVYNRGLAVAYLGLRLLEAAMGLFAATALFVLLSPTEIEVAIEFHEWGFLLVLLVFSIGTLIFYPTLYIYRIVPLFLSIWGLIGGVTLFVSCLLIMFDYSEMGSDIDMVLSLPIWINEMVLALWLIFCGVNHRPELNNAHSQRSV